MGNVVCKLLIEIPQEDKAVVPPLNTIVFVGFRPGLSPSQPPGLVRSAISGAVHSEHYEHEKGAIGEKLSVDSRMEIRL